MNPRETMRGLPRVVQPFLTWVTGVPLSGSRPMAHWRPGFALVAGVVQTVVGVAVSVWALTLPWWALVPLLPLAWMTTAGGMRRLDVVVVHQTLHKMFTRSDFGNRLVSELVTTVLWRPPFDGNRQDHLTHHAFPCSLKDGDTLYLQSTGVRPGMTRGEFREYLVRAVFSPRHHWVFIAGRMKDNFFSSIPAYRLAMSWVALGILIGLLVFTDCWVPWLVAWFVPATFFFQAQTLLYTLSEHRWWLFDNAERLTKAQRDQLTFGRFCGGPVPDTTGIGGARALMSWAMWWTRMVLVYAPYRMFVLVGDTVQHDLHHVRPKCDWANSSWVRNEELAVRPERYFEAWGGLLTHTYAGNSVRDWHVSSSKSLVSVTSTEGGNTA